MKCIICQNEVVNKKHKTCSRNCWSKAHSKIMGGRKGVASSNWKGGEVTIDGRVYIYKPNHPNAMQSGRKYVARSRLVMSEHLNRPLTSSEIVHHVNGDKLDDRVENLMVVTRAKHNTIHHNIKKAEKCIGAFI